LKSWPIERSGFSVFVGDPLTLPDQKSDIKRVLRYIFRSALPLKRLGYGERTGQVYYQDPQGPGKMWPHAVDFLADFVQHIPRARQHQVTYAGYFANALGKLNPKPKNERSEIPEPKRPSRITRWAALYHAESPARRGSPPPTSGEIQGERPSAFSYPPRRQAHPRYFIASSVSLGRPTIVAGRA
jgi:hypothetical protein